MPSKLAHTSDSQHKPARRRRTVLFVLLGFLGLCLTSAAVLLAINASVPSASAAPDQPLVRRSTQVMRDKRRRAMSL